MLDLLLFCLPQLFLIPLAFFWGGCACCGCDICADNFNRSNSSDVSTGSACGYTEIAGDWSIASNKLSVASAFAVLQLGASTTGDNKITVTLTLSEDDEAGRLIFDLVDDDNYLCVEYSRVAGAYHLGIVRRASGVDTSLVDGITSGSTTQTVTACYNAEQGRLVATFDSFGQTSVLETVSVGAIGLGTGAGSTAVEFEDLVVVKSATSGDCLNCQNPCFICSGISPISWQLDFASIANETCGDCNDLNGTYYLSERTSHVSTQCNWSYQHTTGPCSTNWNIHLSMQASSTPGKALIQVTMTPASGAGGEQMLSIDSTHDSPVDCANLTFTDSMADVNATQICTANAGTAQVTITAIPDP